MYSLKQFVAMIAVWNVCVAWVLLSNDVFAQVSGKRSPQKNQTLQKVPLTEISPATVYVRLGLLNGRSEGVRCSLERVMHVHIAAVLICAVVQPHELAMLFKRFTCQLSVFMLDFCPRVYEQRALRHARNQWWRALSGALVARSQHGETFEIA
jgi:hypothetical protein